MDLKAVLKELCNAEGGEFALRVAEKILKEFCEIKRHGNSLIASCGRGETVLLEAHIDEIGLIVTDIKNGFLKVAPVGGVDARMLPGMRVKIHGKTDVLGVACSTPPHLKKDADETPSFDNVYIDTGLGEKAKEIISEGDRISFLGDFCELQGSRVTAKSLDDRAGVAAVLLAAEKLYNEQNVSKKVTVLLSDQEETGGIGAKTAAFSLDPSYAVAVDVSFGNQPGVSECGILGNGAMIGISPFLSHEVTEKLKAVAENNKIKYQSEVMGGRTSTDADHIAISKSGVKTGLLSIPLRNMHTPAEVVDLEDIESVADILAGFVKEL